MSPRSDPAGEASASGTRATGEGSLGKGRSGCWEGRWRRAQCGSASEEEESSRWARRARGAHREMGEAPAAAGSLGGRWGMKMRTLMRSHLSQGRWRATLWPGVHLDSHTKEENLTSAFEFFRRRNIVLKIHRFVFFVCLYIYNCLKLFRRVKLEKKRLRRSSLGFKNK